MMWFRQTKKKSFSNNPLFQDNLILDAKFFKE